MKLIIKDFVKSHIDVLSRIHYLLMNNKVRGKKGNVFNHKCTLFRNLLCSFHGVDNEVVIGGDSLTTLSNCHIIINGNQNKVIIENGVRAIDLAICIENDNNLIYIGKNTWINGKTELAAIEGTDIKIGDDCLLSANITFRTGDSHSVLDALTRKRINPSKSIIIGNHVWIGNTVIVFKGSVVGSHSVIGGGSVVTGKTFNEHTAIGGNPARVIKESVDWDYQRLAIQD